MNKAVKRGLIITAAILGVLLIAFSIIGIRFKMEVSRFHNLETSQRLPSVYAVKSEFVNLYLLPDTGGTFIAVDAGTDVAHVRRGLAELHINPAKVVAVLCTHSDNDHVGGITAFTNAKVIISQDEKQMVDGRTARAMGIAKNSLPVPFTTVANGEEFFAGSHRIKGTLTPGHTPGSICWQIDDSLLFSGDAFGIENGRAGLFSKLFNMNSAEQIQSIAKLSHLSRLKHVFTGHSGQNDDPAMLFAQ